MGWPGKIFLGIVLAGLSTLVARTGFEISYRLGFYPEKWLADLTMGSLSHNLAFWLILSVVALAMWVSLEFAARRWLRPSDNKPSGHTITQFSPPVPAGFYTKKWVLNYNPTNPRGRKNISFNEDGTIGEGRNPNEYRWSYANDHLDIIRQNNDLQNRFKYDPTTVRFICTNDLDARGTNHHIIYQGRV